MDSLMQDARYAWRMLWQRPIVSGVALASLGTGILLPSVVFSLLNAAVLRPLPVRDPDALAVVLEVRQSSVNHNLPYLDFVDYRSAQRAFVDLAAYSADEATVRLGSNAVVTPIELVSGSYFNVLGVPMAAGRPLVDGDDRPGAPPVAVISDALWRQLRGAIDSAFAPLSLTINEQAFDIVGVAAMPFRGTQIGRDARVWIPLSTQAVTDPQAFKQRRTRTASWLTVIGRLKPQMSLESARDDLNRVEAALAPSVGRATAKRFTVVPGRQGDSSLPEVARSPLLLLLYAAVLVLLVACANVANLLIARATERTREMAVRTALGAGRARLARLVVMEASMLAASGAVLALVIAPPVVRQVVPFLGRFGEPVTLDVATDWRTLLFVAGLAVAVTILAGLTPVFAGVRASIAHALAESGRAVSTSRAIARLRHALVVVQFALALALVIVAALMTRTVYNLRTLPTGLDIDHVALLTVHPDAAQYDAARTAAYVEHASLQLRAVPGVRAVGYARVPPLGFGGSRTTIIVPGYSPLEDEDMEINFNRVTPGYAEALGLELLGGRWFDERDTGSAAPAVVINETMARRYWGGAVALGAPIRFTQKGPDVEVVGIVRDVKYRHLREDAGPSFYVPLAQMPAPAGVFHVRTSGAPALLLNDLRRAAGAADAAVPVSIVRTLREQADINVSDERLAMLIASVLGGAALVLAAFGLYASMSYVVGQRSREIGVRVALGATRGEIRRLILRQASWLAFFGTVAGAALAVIFGRIVEARLYGVAAADLPTLIASAGALAAIALLAGDAPARRAARIDPMHALREE